MRRLRRDPRSPGTQQFTIVTAVYDVARFLPDFIESIERQTIGAHRIEVIVVNDGSTDDSLALLDRWSERHPNLVTVISQPNAGQAAARNRGLDVATGDWVGFIDPDDWVVDDYLERVDLFINSHPAASMVACNRVYWDESTGRRRDGHPLRHLFDGDRLVDLTREPDHFHTSAPAAFFRRDRIDRLDLRFDERFRPHFEDGHFCARYLLAEADPTVGFVESAEYLYRRRADNSSTLQSSLTHRGRFVDVPRLGYLDVLERATSLRGSAPRWLQSMVLYELSWYFSADAAPQAAPTAGRGEVGRQFVEVLREIRRFLDDDTIETFGVRRYADEWRQILLHGLTDIAWHSSTIRTTRRRVPKGRVELSYYFVGDEPDEQITDGGRLVDTAFDHTRSVEYFGQRLLWERVVRVEAGAELRVQLDGTEVAVEQLDGRSESATRSDLLRSLPTRIGQRLLDLLAQFPPVARRFDSAWLLIGATPDRSGSVETLYRHLRDNHPEIGARYAVAADRPPLRRGLAAWRADRTIIRVGSIRWRLALRNCTELISSGPGLHFGGTFRATYVSDGTVEDRHAAWLNGVRPDLIVTTFEHEFAAITANRGPWRFEDDQVLRTGSPSLDGIRSRLESFDGTGRDPAVVIATGAASASSELRRAIETAARRYDSPVWELDVDHTGAATRFESALRAVDRLLAAPVVITDDPDVAFCGVVVGAPIIRVGAYAAAGAADDPTAAPLCAASVDDILAKAPTTRTADRLLDGRSSQRLVEFLSS